MSNDLVLFCKSYRRDFLRLRRLLNSIEKHNQDFIPVYICTPSADRELLLDTLETDGGYHWVSDEEIIQNSPNFNEAQFAGMKGGLSQQIIKAEFWRLGLAKNYLCIDSDSIFIKNFYKNDFLAPDGFPFTVIHQNKELFQAAINRGHKRVASDLRAESERVKLIFDRRGPNYYFAPSPFIWSSLVWESFAINYLEPRGIALSDVISSEIPESLVYGEALLSYAAIPLHPIEPLFRVYNYDWEFYLRRRMGETESKLGENYLGVIYQSSWESELHYGASGKSLVSKTLKKVKRFLRFLQSYI